MLAVGAFLSRHRSPTLTDKDTIVLADFDNRTGDSAFDDTLKQALATQLEQSPFLNILSDQRVNQQLHYMGRSTDERLTQGIAREVCQRAGSKAMLVGSITSLGSNYVIGLKAVNCQNGDSLGSEQVEADSREHVLQRLGQAASKMRRKLGESLASVERYDVAVEEATTASLEALKYFRFLPKSVIGVEAA
jgi:eukaryotic-like serine/threonine-protein kinase